MSRTRTPICDFVRSYRDSGTLRAHMPGHKGIGFLGIEALDITEIAGADSLFSAEGIIAESQRLASEAFGSGATYYSTEGSSLCIRAMLYLTALSAERQGRKRKILAGRNAHKTFLTAAALLHFDVQWLYPSSEDGSYLSCRYTPQQLEEVLRGFPEGERPAAFYATSPDYLGFCLNLSGLSEVCHRYGVLFLVDHAHGAYRKFLPSSLHPMDHGVDLCCDSAHKTLPVLTGGAYLHLSRQLPKYLAEKASFALSLFASTSPSYLILQSMDQVNALLYDGTYQARLAEFVASADKAKGRLWEKGYRFVGDEPLKWTILAKDYGYTGTSLAEVLRINGVECEFSDPDYLVLMLTPSFTNGDLLRLESVLQAIPPLTPLLCRPPQSHPLPQVLSLSDALFSPCETVPLSRCEGRVLALSLVSCPPAIPIVACGERMDAAAVEQLRYYGISSCVCVKERPSS